MDPDDRAVGGLNLIDVVNAPHGNLLGQIHSQLAEGPIEPRSVQEQVRAAVETQAPSLQPGRQPSHPVGSLDDADPAAPPRQS